MTIADRIGSDIQRRIASGEWKPGHRIPFEHELVTQYNCARATVGKALTALVRTGLLERRRKAGTFVAYPHVQSAVLDIPDIGKAIILACCRLISARTTGSAGTLPAALGFATPPACIKARTAPLPLKTG
jgi:GntR family histidine utilization transcriptional repressor